MQTKKLSTKKLTFNETKKITDKLNIKAKSKAYFIYDTDLKGFWIRVPANNPSEATYLINTKPQGSRSNTRNSIGKVSLYKASEARAIAREWIQLVKKGINPKEELKRTHAQSQKLSEAFEQYISDKSALGKLSERSEQNYRADMEGRLSSLMNKQINRLTEQTIIDWYKRNQKGSKAQTDRAYRELNAVLNYQVAYKNIESNPAEAVKKLNLRTLPKPKESHLSLEQCGNLIAELIVFRKDNPHLLKQTNLLLFILLTGLRESNTYNLQWKDVTLRDSVFFEQTKNGDTYHLPLTLILNDILEQQRELVPKDCPWVFPNINFTGPIKDMRKAINRLYSEAGINMSFADHDLRRTFATIANHAGITYTDIKQLMIHRKSDITEKYIQNSESKARENYIAISDYLAKCTTIGSGSDIEGELIYKLTPDLMRLVLFDRGPLRNHPDKLEPDFFMYHSEEYYKKDKEIDWD